MHGKSTVQLLIVMINWILDNAVKDRNGDVNSLMNVINKVIEGTHGDCENLEHDQFKSAS